MRCFLVAIAITFLLAPCAYPQTIQNITVALHTTGGAKSWKAQVRAKVTCAGQTLATLQCCSEDQKRDGWADGSTHVRNMEMAMPLPKVALSGCTFELGMMAPAGSAWTVNPTVTVTDDEGKKRQRSFDPVTLESKGSYVSRSFGLDF
jgi:hypothetical protein